MNSTELRGTAFSYLRFSSKRQEQGDSLRRQGEARDRWLARHPGVRLDDSLTLADLGRSAFRGKHRTDDKTALSQFLRAVESGRVKPGSYLIVESLDRLTREELGDAFELVLGLVNRGIRLVQLSPIESILEKPVNMTGLMLALVELSRGRGESQRKSDMLGPAWARKREKCRAEGKPLTSTCKAWLEVDDGEFKFKLGARALIRRIFAMTAAGHGCRTIAGTLNREQVPVWVEGSAWNDVFIRRIISGREVLGEFQPCYQPVDGKRLPAGDPIQGYYPSAITEAEWGAAASARKSRDKRGGRPTNDPKHIGVFQGLLRDGVSGEALNVLRRNSYRTLVRSGVRRRGEGGTSFPLEALERGLLSKFREIDPREVLDDNHDAPDEVAELTAKLARLDSQLQALADQFDGDGEIPQIAAKAKAKHAERQAAVEALEAAQTRAATPLSTAWTSCAGLVKALDKATPDKQREMRVRLRAVVGRIVESVTCVFVDRSYTRLAAVRVQFTQGGHRDYLISFTHAHAPSKRPKALECVAFKSAGLEGIDLRRRADAAKVEKFLGRLELE